MYPNVLLNIFSSSFLLTSFGSLNIRNSKVSTYIIQFIAKFTGGIYYIHPVIVRFVLFYLEKKNSCFRSIFTYINCYLICFIANKIFMKTEIKYSLGELIDGKNLNKLKTEVEKRERYKEKLGVINEQKFRTNYALKPKIQELKEILNYKKIKGDKLELIKYIQTHGHITDLFLKNLVTSDKNDINKYEKISQTLLFNKEMDLKFLSEIQRKVKMKQNLTKLRINNNLNRMDKEIKLEHEILDKYQKLKDKKLNYIEIHKEIEKTWKKSGINHLATRKTLPAKQLSDSTSN